MGENFGFNCRLPDTQIRASLYRQRPFHPRVSPDLLNSAPPIQGMELRGYPVPDRPHRVRMACVQPLQAHDGFNQAPDGSRFALQPTHRVEKHSVHLALAEVFVPMDGL